MEMEEVLARLRASAAYLAVVTPNWLRDVDCLVLTRYAVELEKPIVLFVRRDVQEGDIPAWIREAAFTVIWWTDDDDREATRAVTTVLARLAEGGDE
jgi:hypothetical protein